MGTGDEAAMADEAACCPERADAIGCRCGGEATLGADKLRGVHVDENASKLTGGCCAGLMCVEAAF
jgi:hypothetical protein